MVSSHLIVHDEPKVYTGRSADVKETEDNTPTDKRGAQTGVVIVSTNRTIDEMRFNVSTFSKIEMSLTNALASCVQSMCLVMCFYLSHNRINAFLLSTIRVFS